jgi:hypothetical protein
VDIYVIVEETGLEQQKRSYKGLLLEMTFKNPDEYRSAEAVLSDPTNAHNLTVPSVISDPTGKLTRLQQTVAQEFAQRRWVQARCEWEKRMILRYLERMSQTDISPKRLWYHTLVVMFLAGLIAVAHLKGPTVRRCLVRARELLQSQGKQALYEMLLELHGCTDMDQEQVKYHLEECVRVFDRAAEVIQTHFLGSYNIHPCVRPYLKEGALEMINEGNHREAMFWIGFFHSLACIAIRNDAAEEESRYQSGLDSLLGALGLHTRDDWQSRIQLARDVADQFLELAGEVVETHPDIQV